MTVFAIGLDTDKTYIDFLAQAHKLGVDVRPLNLRAVVDDGSYHLSLSTSGETWISAAGEKIHLDPTASFFCRLVDLSQVQDDMSIANRWRGLIAGLTAWLEQVPGIVVNRPGSRCDNFTKPLHEALLRQSGFLVPPSLMTSDRDRLRRFCEREPAIIKTVSSTRGDARLVSAADFDDFAPEQGPVHVQRYVPGGDVRAHVVADEVHAEFIRAEGVDYRNSDGDTEYSPHDLPRALCEQLIESTRAYGLVFAGWDFKLTEAGRYYCLEANPMPGYHGYDRRLGRRITRSLFRVLGAAFSSGEVSNDDYDVAAAQP
jgi:hypothetical protein